MLKNSKKNIVINANRTCTLGFKKKANHKKDLFKICQQIIM